MKKRIVAALLILAVLTTPALARVFLNDPFTSLGKWWTKIYNVDAIGGQVRFDMTYGVITGYILTTRGAGWPVTITCKCTAAHSPLGATQGIGIYVDNGTFYANSFWMQFEQQGDDTYQFNYQKNNGGVHYENTNYDYPYQKMIVQPTKIECWQSKDNVNWVLKYTDNSPSPTWTRIGILALGDRGYEYADDFKMVSPSGGVMIGK